MTPTSIRLIRLIALLMVCALLLENVIPSVYAQEPLPPTIPSPFTQDVPPASCTISSMDAYIVSIDSSAVDPPPSSCCGYISSGNPYSCCATCIKWSGNNCIESKQNGNCTWWAWREYNNNNGQAPPCGGNAYKWKSCAQPDGSPPRVGSVVVLQPGVYGAHSSSVPEWGCPNGCGHVAYVEWVDNPINPTHFSYSDMGCSGNCVVGHSNPKTVINGVNFIYPPGPVDNIKPYNPNSITSSSHAINQWSANEFITIQWAGAVDPGNPTSGIGGYAWVWSQDPSTVPHAIQQADENTNQFKNNTPLSTSKTWYFHVRARDKSNNWADGAAHYGPFWIDGNSPNNPTSVLETHGAPDAWQNRVNDPAFVWSGASDLGSGIAYYKYHWDEDASGEPSIQTVSNSFDPPAPCESGDVCQRYLRLQTIDVSGRRSEPVTLFNFRYDGQPPTGDFQINNGSTVAFQVAVRIHVNANDVGSGVSLMRVSNDGFNWPNGWQKFETDFWWLLDAVPDLTQTVHLELQDLAGNTAALPPQSIQLDLSGQRPHSANYQIFTDVQARGGGARKSTTYSLNSTLGQVIAGNGVAGQLYKLESGFQGAWLAQPFGPPPTEHYHLLDSVIGQGGGHKLSQNYQMNSTGGQFTQTGERTSPNYKLTSGFWARVMNLGKLELANSSRLEVTATSTSAPMITNTIRPTPSSPTEYYGVSINRAALFTHEYRVTLYLDAVDAVEMMVSNDGGFSNAYWEAYDVTKTWEIDFYQNYVLPRTVYVRYRDANGTIRGNFTDDIIYDPNLPTGNASVISVGNDSVVLNINLQDDLSGVSEMLVATESNLATAKWEAYSTFKTISAEPGDAIYVYYRDAAGNESLYPLEIKVPDGMHNLYLPLTLKK